VLDPSKTNEHDIEDEMEKYERYTTFMYRPPEMIDKYRGWKVSLKADIWMLGCVLFALCFFKHPFQDAQKLAILNAHYFFPNDNESKRRIGEKLRDLIRHMLTPNPEKRPDIFEVEDLIETWEDHDAIKLNEEAQKLKDEELRKQGRNSKAPKTTVAKSSVSTTKDISEEEIRNVQNKLKKQRLEEQKKHQVPLHGNYQKKMHEELYSKNNANDGAKKIQKQNDDFDWDFNQPSKFF
jgi:AP2-associated kinase